MEREALLTRTFVELADTLVDDFDVTELLTLLVDRCVEALDVSAAGLLLVAPEGDLRVMASSNEAMRILQDFELSSAEGPCLDCYRTGKPVVNETLAGGGHWPRFTPVALEAGFRSVYAVPMRLRRSILGALNLFGSEERTLSEQDLLAAQAFADVATIAVLQNRAIVEAQILADQLNHALNSRVVIEQAKGVLAERLGIGMEQAFTRLRTHARNHNLRLAVLAQGLVDGTLNVDALDPPRH